MIYLDNSATTKVSKAAADKALFVMTQQFGNPSSLHKLGFLAELEIKNARRIISNALGCREGELYFLSGGTEANNTAVLGTAYAKKRQGNKIVVSSIEHSSVIEAADYLSKNGFEVVRVKPNESGVVTPESIAAAVDDKTVLVSLMLVNNEVGSVMDIATAAAAARRKNPKITVHCDAVGAFGKIPVNTGRLGVDLLSISAHKIHAPKGCGALFVKKGTKIEPLIFGGHQQNKVRPGTENAPAIAAFSVASEQSIASMAQSFKKAKELSSYLTEKLSQLKVQINSKNTGFPYIVNFSTMCIKSETLMHFLEQREIYVSSGSACSKGAKSHVLTAMGLCDKAVDTAIRVSLDADNTIEEIDTFVDALKQAMETLQKIK